MKGKNILATVLGTSVGAIGATVAVGNMTGKSVNRWKNLSDKHLALFVMMCQWVKIKQEGKNLSEYFVKNGYKRIAVYGMSYAGETFVSELKDTAVEIAYGIDKNATSIYADIDIVSMDDELEEVDVIIVTAITFFDEIERALSEKLDCPIISLEDVLYEM